MIFASLIRSLLLLLTEEAPTEEAPPSRRVSIEKATILPPYRVATSGWP